MGNFIPGPDHFGFFFVGTGYGITDPQTRKKEGKCPVGTTGQVEHIQIEYDVYSYVGIDPPCPSRSFRNYVHTHDNNTQLSISFAVANNVRAMHSYAP